MNQGDHDMSETPATFLPANWYPDYADSRMVRWWDGLQWTDYTAPAGAPAGAQAAVQTAPTLLATPSSYAVGRPSTANPYSNPAINAVVNSIATRALIYSLIGLFINPFAILSIGGLVLGIRALRRAPQFAEESSRRTSASVAIVLGSVGTIFTVCVITAFAVRTFANPS
jgi:hypothetical protein